LNNLKDTTNNSIKKKSFPIMALTATATEKVREDIVKRLDL
jgi:superfamily II DNA helicase RecQ